MPQLFLNHPRLPVGFFCLLIQPFSDLKRGRYVAWQGCLKQPGFQFDLIFPIPLDPGRKVVLGCEKML
jgi:hypothetical protein